jgi:hypothetical protein
MSLSYSEVLRNSIFVPWFLCPKEILKTIDLGLDETPIENNNKEESRFGVHEDDALANLHYFQRFRAIKASSDKWICLQAN